MSAPTSPDASGPTRAVILLGSNIEPEANLPRALRRLREILPILAVSRVYESDPVDAPGTPRFLNAAVLVETTLPPAVLKHQMLRPLEAELGRVRTAQRSAPRTIDLDLVLYGDAVFDDDATGIHLPEPGLLRHAHLALPVADVTPEWLHPTLETTAAAIAEIFRSHPEIELKEIRPWPREASVPSSPSP